MNVSPQENIDAGCHLLTLNWPCLWPLVLDFIQCNEPLHISWLLFTIASNTKCQTSYLEGKSQLDHSSKECCIHFVKHKAIKSNHPGTIAFPTPHECSRASFLLMLRWMELKTQKFIGPYWGFLENSRYLARPS